MRQRGFTMDKDLWLVVLRQWAIALLLCGLMYGMDRIGSLGWLRGGVELVVRPIDTIVLKAADQISLPWRWVMAGRKDFNQMADLEERLAAAAVDRSRLRELEDRVVTLESLMVRVGAGKRADRIVPILDYGDRLMVATGMSEGVVVGQVLTDNQGVLMGKINKIGKYLSEVQQISDVGSRIAVETQTGFSKGIVVGRGKFGEAELMEVLQSETLAVGEILVTTGVDGAYPAGLVVGQVTELLGKPEDVTRGAVVALLASRKGWAALW